MHRNLSTSRSGFTGLSQPNTAWAQASSNVNSTAASIFRARVHVSGVGTLHSRSTGATSSAPPMSPSHHVSQMLPNRSQLDVPPSTRLKPPTVALSAVLTTPASAANRNASMPVKNAERPPANRLTSHAPASASSVLPVAIPRQVAADPEVVMFATNARARSRQAR
jgi:hypothetical protein